jgi:hypothetical protein
MVTIRFMTLTGQFRQSHINTFETYAQALAAIQIYAATGGYTNVKAIECDDTTRYTARTPGGRSGRNVAYRDFGDNYT